MAKSLSAMVGAGQALVLAGQLCEGTRGVEEKEGGEREKENENENEQGIGKGAQKEEKEGSTPVLATSAGARAFLSSASAFAIRTAQVTRRSFRRRRAVSRGNPNASKTVHCTERERERERE